ncbi:PilW family protein [Fuchsiella alkaliacetigena]|uniref:PilW family protein n=1 Tax=Fuchsiella alkaliacetigena TaxID=957042 RepID=UPI002009F4F9|nr:prepilin-type N-terminal cleavage/methylation domain-containing protein [Fuchsiella alkaliacetigena]MCK8825284.1 prepilin-type N-terminal cleavage/methylation domain-containing protein [Fuchsiella alkaliacetigena]
MGSFGREEQAVTLIELLIVIAIIGIIFTAIYSTQLTGWRVWNFSQDQVELQQTARLLMMIVARDVRRAMEVEVKDEGYRVVLIYMEEEQAEEEEVQKIEYEIDDNEVKRRKKEKEDGKVNWGNRQPLTTEIIDLEAYQEQKPPFNKEDRLVTIIFNLKKRDHNYQLENKIYFRN